MGLRILATSLLHCGNGRYNGKSLIVYSELKFTPPMPGHVFSPLKDTLDPPAEDLFPSSVLFLCSLHRPTAPLLTLCCPLIIYVLFSWAQR